MISEIAKKLGIDLKEAKTPTEVYEEIVHQLERVPYVPFPTAFHTTDIIATKYDDGIQILLGKKYNNDGWQFIGGFVEPTHSAEKTASKEFYEEASVSIPEKRFRYITSQFVDDSRFKDSCHKVTTSLFTVRLTLDEASKVQGGDDIETVKWVGINEVYGQLRELHKPLFIHFLMFQGKI